MSENKQDPLSGLKSLLRSRKFWLAVIAVIQTTIFHFFPALPPELWKAINTILLTLIGTIAVEDAARKINSK